MRTIIAGSRGLGILEVEKAMGVCGWTPTLVLSGTAMGVDRAGEIWAKLRAIPIERYPADWATHGLSAGYKRNRAMAEKAQALVAVWDGKSRGTANMIQEAKNLGLKVYIWRTEV